MKRILFVLCTLVFGFAQAQTLTVWVWDINKPALESTIASFQEMHPDVDVVVEDLGNQNVYDRGLAGCAAGGFDLPDVYLVENNEAPVFWAQFPDCFVDLRDLGAEELLTEFPDFKWPELRGQDGAIYAIPYDSGPTAIFYRRDLYAEAGIDPDEIATWDDFIAAGVQLNETFGGEVKMGTISKGGDDEWFRMIANQAGCFYFSPDGNEITVNQPGCVQALEQIGDLWNADVLLPGGWVEQIQYFQNGLEASAFFGAWYAGTIITNAPDQAGLWGVYQTPALEEGGIRAANLGGSALAITSASDNPELAYDFVVNALADVDNQVEILFEYGLVPSYLEVQDTEAVEQSVAYFGDQPVWDLLLGTLGDVSPANGTQFFQEARNVMTSVLNDYLNGDYDSAQAALDRAAEQIAQATGLPTAE